MDIPLVLSGTFGELRSNHFHSGLDIKTQQRTGIKVYSTAPGYVSRIKIQRFGYGKAVYVTHPSGHTSVYAHLSKLGPGLEEYIKKKQYDAEQYEIEVFPTASELPVERGQHIAYSGNSGGSGGPHLHFEIRDGAARPLNPMDLGIDIKDTRPPLVKSFWAYPITDDARVNGKSTPQQIKITKGQDGTWRAANVRVYGRVGFGVNTSDRQDAANNQNGVYQIKTELNGTTQFQMDLKRYAFNETRYLNDQIDYKYFKENRSRITKLFRGPNNPLSIITEEVNSGYVDVFDENEKVYCVTIRDYAGNESVIMMNIELGELPKLIDTPQAGDMTLASPSNATEWEDGQWKVYIPSGALYEPAYLDIQNNNGNLHFHKDVVPLHKNATISFQLPQGAGNDDKMYIARKSWNNHYYVGNRMKGDRLSASTRTLGTYTIRRDSIAPTVRPKGWKDGAWMSSKKKLQFAIADADTGIDAYRVKINDKWALFEYDYKTGLITYDFDDGLTDNGANTVKVIVTDKVGNSSTFSATINRKQT